MRALIPLLVVVLVGASLLVAAPVRAQTFSSAVWQLVQLPGKSPLATPSSIFTVQFLSDGRVAILARCDRASGAWKSAGTLLTITITLNVGCTDGQTFLAYLAETESFALDDDTLTLHGAAAGDMVFRLAPI